MNYAFFRVLKFAFQDFYRNFWLSIVTITVLILALLSINVLVSLNAVSEKMIGSVKDKIDVSVFFKRDITQSKIDNFQEKIKKLQEVKETNFIAKNQALATFKDIHKDDASIMEALKEVEKNPLSDALIIKAHNTEDYGKILNILNLPENQEIIKYQNFTNHKTIIERVTVFSDKVKKFGIGLSAIFSLIAVLIVFNAIRVTIYTHREEISVMRLVGASNSFIRAPFLIESILYSLIAMGSTILILYGSFAALSPYLSLFLGAYDFNLAEYYNNNFMIIFGAELGAVIILNVVSSGIAIARYLKV